MKPRESETTPASANPDDDLPRAALEQLLLDAAPVDMPAGLPARVRDRLSARIAADAKPASKSSATAPHAAATDALQFINIRFDDGWTTWPGAEGKAEMKTLFDDGITLSMLVRMAPGCELEGHGHDAPEECLCVRGDVWLNDSLLRAGDYEVALPGTAHQRIRSDSGCLLFVRAPSPRAAGATAMSV
jgi:hypothetical protein